MMKKSLMMENKATPSQEQHIQDAASNKSDFIKINNDVYAVIQPNKIFYIKKEKLDNFKDYLIPKIKKQENKILSFYELFILSIATSLDALAIGISLSLLNISIFFSAFVIGIITFINHVL